MAENFDASKVDSEQVQSLYGAKSVHVKAVENDVLLVKLNYKN